MAHLKHSRSWFWSFRLTVLDLLSLSICGVISSELRGYSTSLPNFTVLDGFMVIVTCLTCLTIVGGYETKRDMCTLRYTSEHVLAMGIVLLVAFLTTYVFSAFNNLVKPGRSVLFIGLLLFTPLSLAYRYRFSIRDRAKAAARSIYVIGTPKLASDLRSDCLDASFQHPMVFIDLESVQASGETLSEDNPLQKLLHNGTNQCEGLVIDLTQGKVGRTLESLLLNINLHSVPVYPVESFIETYFHKVDLSHVDLSLALNGTFKADHHSSYGKLKSMLDVIVGLFLFLAALPIMLVIALVIRIVDSGPVLFKQVRVGRFERPFVIYKFRTMSAKVEHDNLYTEKNDPRITALGGFLRRTRLDELPQLWNVAKGDMSMIGPRAEWDKLSSIYKTEIPFYNLRWMVKPGITGWAQVNYGYGSDVKDTIEKLEYDLYYIKHCSPQMDASIILKTCFTILSASGR